MPSIKTANKKKKKQEECKSFATICGIANTLSDKVKKAKSITAYNPKNHKKSVGPVIGYVLPCFRFSGLPQK